MVSRVSATFDASALEGLLPGLPIMMGILSPDGTVLGATMSAAAASTAPAGESINGRRIRDIAPGTGMLVEATVAQVARTGEVITDQYIPWTTADGASEVWKYAYFPIVSQENVVTSVGVVMEEVGEREQLRGRMQSLEALIEQSSDFVAVVTLDTRTVYLNPAGRALVGHGPGDALLEDSGGYLAEESKVHRPGLLAAALNGTWRGRLNLRHVVTGESIAVDATVFVVRDEQTNEPLFRAAVMRDMREHEQLVRRLELQIERIPVALVTLSAGGDVQRWNPAAEKLFGHTEAEAAGRPLPELIGSPGLASVIRGADSSDTVIAAVTRSGEGLLVQWSAVPLEHAPDSTEAVMLIGHDLTEQLRAEAERKEALRIAAMATWSADLDLRQMTWSDELFELAGVDPKTFVPTFQSSWRLLKPSERARARRLRRRMATIPQFRFTFEIVRPSDGAARWLEIEGHRQPDEDRLLGTARDVTMQRRAADRLRELDVQRRKLLERMLLSEEEERGRIARALHDDTVQLLAALQLNLDRIQMVLGGEPAAATTLVAETRSALSDALDRTRHLMFELRPQRFDRHGLREAITALCEQIAAEAGFTVSVDVSEQRFDGVVEELCYRTVREAVINARKHSGATHLSVSVNPQPGEIRGVVHDDGAGFDPRRFDRSHLRLHMGLDAMAERIRLAGGSSEVVSDRGKGCTVSFSIPVIATPGRWDGVV